MTIFSCPTCRSEDMERRFAQSKVLSGWSWFCRACKYAGVEADRWRDPDDVEERYPVEREPFNDWPNGQGMYD